MATLYATRGLPGSGKSTLARAWVAESPTMRARVNRDDLRAMMHDSVHIKGREGEPGTEAAIIAARDAVILALLRQGLDVISDDTNLPGWAVRDLRAVARRAGAKFEVIDMRGVSPEVCIERDAKRTGRARVGEDVIRGMAKQHLAPEVAA